MSNAKKMTALFETSASMALDQAARQYYKKAVKILKNFEFVGGNVDPCLYVKKGVKGVVYVALYVDDYLMVGDIAAIDDTISALKSNMLVLKVIKDCRTICPEK